MKMNYNPFVTLYIVDIYTTWLAVPRFVVKYKEYIFPKKLVIALGSWFPLFAKSLTFFIIISYFVIVTGTILFLLKKEKIKACDILLLILFAKDIFFIALRIIEKYNL